MNFKWEHSKIFAILISLFFIGCDALQFEPPIETSSITVTSPNGYEEWTQGSTNTITWTSENLNGYVDIHLYRSSSHNGYYSFYQYIDNYSNNDGSHTWTISDSLSASYYYKVRIEEHDNSSVYDESDSYFSITICIKENYI